MAKAGRKAFEYNPAHARQVKALSQYGVPYEDIAASIGMGDDTMVKLYKKELAEGRAIANATLGKRLFEKAMEGDTTALIFLAKVRLRMRTEDKEDKKERASATARDILCAVADAFNSVGRGKD